MESLVEFLEPLARLISTAMVIVLFFLFIVRPLLKYLIVNREIEHLKKLNEEMLAVDSLDPANDDSGEEEKLAGHTVGQSQRVTEKEALNRLATSDPDKASDLVRKWVNSD